jgi:hypothetical protein
MASRVLPFNKLHGQKRPAIRERSDLVHGRDAGVLQLTGDACLAEKPLGGERIGGIALGQQFDRDVAIEYHVTGAIDDAHTSAADLGD